MNLKQKQNTNKNAYTDDYGTEFGSDETFAFIAGFTEGGAPYGTTWKKWGEIKKFELNEAKWNKPSEVKYNDLPF